MANETFGSLVGATIGSVSAGPVGTLVGSVIGGFLARILPSWSDIASDVVGSLGADVVKESANIIWNRINPKRQELVRKDLHDAYYDAFHQAVYDMGGVACFPDVKKNIVNNEPDRFDYSFPVGLIKYKDKTLAAAVCACLQNLADLTPNDLPIVQQRPLFSASLDPEYFAGLNDIFCEEIIIPYLSHHTSLTQKLKALDTTPPPFENQQRTGSIYDLENHLCKHLMRRMLVHFGDNLKQRPQAWQEFNRLVLDTLLLTVQSGISELADGQYRIQQAIEQLQQIIADLNFKDWSEKIADLMTRLDQIEIDQDIKWDKLTELLRNEQSEVISRFIQQDTQLGRIEAKLDAHLLDSTGTVPQSYSFPRINYRSDIADILDFYTKVFVGRETETQQIAEFAKSKEPGYILVEAPAGFGKTALIAHLIHQHETRSYDQQIKPTLLYFFIRQFKAQNTTEAFLKAVNSQLLSALGKYGGIASDVGSLHAQFSDLWTLAIEEANKEKPLLLLVDGLDEIATGVPTIANELPLTLGSYVHIVITSRENPEPLRQISLEHPFRQTEVLRLNALTKSDIRDLFQAFDWTTEVNDSLITRILNLTKGEPLLTRFVSQEVAEAEHEDTALVTLEKNPPKGVQDYFERQLDHLKTMVDSILTQEVLGLLIVTRGGITVPEIGDVLGKTTWDVEEAVQPIRRFLIGHERLELMHLEFHRAIEKLFLPRKIKQLEESILHWGHRYQNENWPADTPNYILLHYANHLYKSHKADDLYRLISKQWLDAKFSLTYSNYAFVDDVLLAIKSAKEGRRVQWVPFVRGCLINAMLRAFATNLPMNIFSPLVLLGRTDSALKYVTLISDSEKKCIAYLTIAHHLIEEDQLQVQFILNKALAEANIIVNEEVKADVLTQLAVALVQAGKPMGAIDVLDQALVVASTISNEWDTMNVLKRIIAVSIQLFVPDKAVNTLNKALEVANAVGGAYKDPMIWEIAGSLAQVGKVDQALKLANSFVDEYSKAIALNRISVGLAIFGDVDQAIRVTKIIVDYWYQVDALRQIASILIQSDERAQAIIILNQAHAILITLSIDKASKEYVSSKIAIELATAGEIDQALALANAISSPWHKANALIGIADVLIQRGKSAKAVAILNQILNFVNTIDSEWHQTNVLSQIAATLIQVNDADNAIVILIQALRVATNIVEKSSKVEMLSQISITLAEVGEINQALMVVNKIADEHSKAEALSRISITLAELGEINQALTVVNKIADEDQLKADTLSRVATVLAETGESIQANIILNQALTINTGFTTYEETKVDVFWRVAIQMAQIGEIEKALTIAEGITSEEAKSKAFREIAIQMAQAGEIEKALTIAEGIASEETKSEAFREIAIQMAQAGEIEKALTIAEGIASEETKSEAFMQITALLAQIGEIEKALTIAEGITSEEAKSKAFREIAIQMAQAGEIEKALTIAEGIASEETKSEAFREIAIQMAEAGEIEKALTIANGIIAEKTKARAFMQITALLAQIGEIEKAFAIAYSIVDKWFKVIALRTIAVKLHQVGESTTGNATFEQALMVANDIADEQSKAIAIKLIADQLIETGETVTALAILDQALDVANTILNERAKAKTLGLIAKAQIRVGAIYQALKLTNSITNKYLKEEERREILSALVKAGHIDRVYTIMNTLGDFDKTLALEIIAQRLTQADKLGLEEKRAVRVFEAAYNHKLDTFLKVIASATPFLVSIDNGRTLYEIFETFQELESWLR